MARHDVSIAKDLQKEEIIDFREQEARRRAELRERYTHTRTHAHTHTHTHFYFSLRRELEDLKHAEEMSQKLKEVVSVCVCIHKSTM